MPDENFKAAGVRTNTHTAARTAFTTALRRAWQRVNEPRVISVLYFLQYVVMAGVGVYALLEPPTSVEGRIGGTAMTLLATLLTVGGLIGSIAALPGKYWLERLAVGAVALSSVIYLGIVVWLHVSTGGNRTLQAAFVATVLFHQGVRWVRIKDRPYRPADLREA